MNIKTDKNGSIVIIKILDQELIEPEKLLNVIQTSIEQNMKGILIDLNDVTYISSIVLGSFVTSYKNIESKNGQLKFVNVQPCVANIFEMTRLNRIFEFFNDKETALKSFSVSV